MPITLEQAQTEAHDWVVSRKDTIQDRVMACISEGNPRLCHTSWAASVTPNTDPADSALATVTLDDPGVWMETPCGNCFDPTRATFDEAGIAIPATAPINARIRIMRSAAGWGVVVVIKIKYDGVEYERGYGRGIASGFGWREVAVEL